MNVLRSISEVNMWVWLLANPAGTHAEPLYHTDTKLYQNRNWHRRTRAQVGDQNMVLWIV